MLEDYYVDNGNNLQMASVKLLNDIHERFRDEEKEAELYGFPPPVSAKTELELERLRYNTTEQAALLRTLQELIPNTDEQENLFRILKRDLDTLKEYLISGHELYGKFIFIQGQGGSGKSTFAKKLLAYARSIGLIAKGCSSTGLSCQVYEAFTTAHTLFGIPVSEDEDGDYDHDAKIFSTMSPQRKEILNNTSLIIWDEFLSNHKQCIQCAYDATDKFSNCIVVCMGDYRQIAPVVVKGTIADTINASPLSANLWDRFRIFKFTRNMRLFGRPNLDLRDVHEQTEYAEMLLELSEGYSYSGRRVQSLIDTDPETGSSLVRLPLIKALHYPTEALAFVFPDGFSPNTMHKASILASTNEEGDNWNKLVQDMNPNESKTYLSADVFDQIDDPNGFVQEMLTTEALNSFSKNGCPAHKLHLKVNDICIILRNINKRDGLTNNTRVRITHLTTFSIRIQTLGEIPKSHILPRIKFKFKIPFGTAFTMTRTQFPLRLAYCMTFNKAQGQEWDKVLADTRNAPFSHGHLYVVASRIRHNNNIRIFCDKDEQMVDGAPVVTNVVYKQLKIA